MVEQENGCSYMIRGEILLIARIFLFFTEKEKESASCIIISIRLANGEKHFFQLWLMLIPFPPQLS